MRPHNFVVRVPSRAAMVLAGAGGRALARRALAQYHPAAAFAPVTDSMLVALSMQHALGGARTHSDLVRKLEAGGLFRSQAVRAAFAAVDRARFVPADIGGGGADRRLIYDDRAIRCGQAGSLCSPSMQVMVLEHLGPAALGPGRRALDIGTGTGAMAVLMAEIGAAVDAIDIDADAIAFASARHPHGRIRWKHQNAFAVAGDDAAGTYDCVHVGACVEFVPDSWLDVLKVGGVMIVPIGRADCEQTLMKLTKSADILDGRHIVLRNALQPCKYEAMRSSSASSSDSGSEPRDDDRCGPDLVRAELRGWYEAFRNDHGRTPNLSDVKSDARVSELLSSYRKRSRTRSPL